MNKIFSKIITIAFIFVTTSCSYKPIFSEKNYNFQIDELILSGDEDVNRIIDRGGEGRRFRHHCVSEHSGGVLKSSKLRFYRTMQAELLTLGKL